MRMMCVMLMVVVLISGCASQQSMDSDAALDKVMDKVPTCGATLETINHVIETTENENGFTVIIAQDCEPEHGEGPQMRSTYTYVVTSNNDVQLVEKNGL